LPLSFASSPFASRGGAPSDTFSVSGRQVPQISAAERGLPRFCPTPSQSLSSERDDASSADASRLLGVIVPGANRQTRKPWFLLRLSGLLLLRYAARQFLAELFQEPPRITRLAAQHHPTTITHRRHLNITNSAANRRKTNPTSTLHGPCTQVPPHTIIPHNKQNTLQSQNSQKPTENPITLPAQIQNRHPITTTVVKCRPSPSAV
jgi:hypothetical protein